MNENIAKEGVKFSKDNQPSPKAKSEGLKRFHDRKKIRDDFFKEFSKTILANGAKVDTFQECVKVLKKVIFTNAAIITVEDSDSDKREIHLSNVSMGQKQAELVLKIFDFLSPSEKQELKATVVIDNKDVGVNKLAAMLDELKQPESKSS